MKLVMLPVLVALLAQFGTLPILIGAKSGGEAIGWPLIMAIFFGLPSAAVYLLMFTGMRVAMPPAWLAVTLGIAIPAMIVLAFYRYRGVAIDLSPRNWVMWMGIIGGLAGTITHLYLRSGSPSAA